MVFPTFFNLSLNFIIQSLWSELQSTPDLVFANCIELKTREITLLTKIHLVKATFFSSSHVCMWELDYKECWSPKNWCFWTMVLEKTLESPLDCKEIQPVYPKGNQFLIFIGRTDSEAETLIFRSPDVKNLLIGKDPDTGKDWRQEEKGTTEDEMIE